MISSSFDSTRQKSAGADGAGGADDCAAGERGGPTSTGADEVERCDVGVPVDDLHALHRHAELVGGELSEGRLVALPCGCWLVNTVNEPSGSRRTRASWTVRGAAMNPIALIRLGGTGAGST